jgi:cytochrome c-type biogenesis protein
LIPTFLFTVGFSIVFIIFGAASTFLGQVLLQNSEMNLEFLQV